MDVSFAPQNLTSSRIGFSGSFYRMLSRVDIPSSLIETANATDLKVALAFVSQTLSISDTDHVVSIFNKNPKLFRYIRNGDDILASAMMAYLPLNSVGAAALVDGSFDGTAPNLDWICAPHEKPEAVYIWTVFAPKQMLLGLRFIQELELIGHGAPIFARPVNPNSARILDNIGFMSASSLFPAAPNWLVVALPQGKVTTGDRNAPVIQISVARTLDDIMKVFAIRAATYIAEQLPTYDEEFDGNDFCGTHLIGTIDGEPAACVRIRYFGDFVKLERVAVRREYRHTRIALALARSCIAHCRKKGFSRLYGHARSDLVPMWRRFGAKPVAGRREFQFSDIHFVEMCLDLAPDENAIRYGVDPMLIIRPEGQWDRLGPLDRAQLNPVAERAELIAKSIKRISSRDP